MGIESHYMEQHLGQLVGGTIVGMCSDKPEPGEPTFYGLLVLMDNGERRRIAWIQCDPEGNGPGHLAIEDDEEFNQMRAKPAKPVTPTVAQLMALHDHIGGRFFSAENMKAAGQRRIDFRMSKTAEPGVFFMTCQSRTHKTWVSRLYISGRTGEAVSEGIAQAGIPEGFLERHKAAPIGRFG